MTKVAQASRQYGRLYKKYKKTVWTSTLQTAQMSMPKTAWLGIDIGGMKVYA